jgi:hypothetical protein
MVVDIFVVIARRAVTVVIDVVVRRAVTIIVVNFMLDI